MQMVQSSLGAMLPPSLWLSEKSILWLGSGTMPGSVNTARACAMNSRKMRRLKLTTWKLPHKLPDIVCSTIHLQPQGWEIQLLLLSTPHLTTT